MPKLATTHSLANYPRLPISQYRDQLRQTKGKIATSVSLSYAYRGKDYRYSINVTTTPANYGGYRYWWLCPKCGRRVGVLYCAGIYVCRHCIGANYQVQLLQTLERRFKRCEAIRAKLGWQVGIIHGIGHKPKGMHQTTYDKFVSEYQSLIDGITANMANRLDKGTP